MAYKDKDKQKLSQRDWVRQKRANKGSTAPKVEGSTTETVVYDLSCLKESVIPNYGQPDCECMHCQSNRANDNRHIINHEPYKTDLAANEINRVSLPGDPDYAGVCQV